MANQCCTKLEIVNNGTKESINELETFYAYLQSCLHSTENNQYGENWTGKILFNSNMFNENEKKTIKHGGFLNGIYYDDGVITIFVITDWSPELELWQKLLDKLHLDFKIYYIASECEFDLYETNKMELAGTYEVDSPDTDMYGSFIKENELKETLQKYFDTEEDDINKLIDEFNIKSGNTIHQWEYVDIQDCY